MCACADCAAKEIQARVLRNYLSVKTAGQSVNMVIVSVIIIIRGGSAYLLRTLYTSH